MGFFVLVLFSLLTLACFAHSNNKHMICKDVGDVFDYGTSSDVRTRGPIGPAGKRGSKGERGFPGLKGEPGEVNDERLQEVVRAKVEEENRVLQARVEKMEAQIQYLTTQISETQKFQEEREEKKEQVQNQETKQAPVVCNDGVIYEGNCYWAEVHSSRDTIYAKAQDICAKKGSRLADIYGKTHYDEIMNYLRRKLRGRSYIYVWTRMKKLYQNGIAQLSNGTPASYTHPHREAIVWNYAVKIRNHVYLEVRESATDLDQGMAASWPTYELHGALCQ